MFGDDELLQQIHIRTFCDQDAEFCFKIRAHAFVTRFKQEIGEEAVVAGINAFQPCDFKRIDRDAEFFIVEVGGQPAGFFIIRRIDPKTAELVLLYIDLKFESRGLGRYCCNYLERWIVSNWNDIEKIHVDTIIPNTNAGFYQKFGFQKKETVSCAFPGLTIPAVRLEKSLTPV